MSIYQGKYGKNITWKSGSNIIFTKKRNHKKLDLGIAAMKLSLLTFLHYQGFTKDLCGAFEHYIYHLHGEICCRFFEISLHNRETLRVFRARTWNLDLDMKLCKWNLTFLWFIKVIVNNKIYIHWMLVSLFACYNQTCLLISA